MTIDEAIKHGEEQLEIFGGVHKEFIEISIDTMHKYQKIQQIVKEWEFDHESMVDSMEKISEVLEDGKID